ncbi:unnamed protein product [Alopecurus aequalis]
MAALLRQGARRIGGSVLQRTQAAVTSPAVAEERRRLVPRRMLSTEKTPSEKEVQKKKEELYEVISNMENWQNRRLLQDLAAHVTPRKDRQWYRLRAQKWATNVVRVVANVSFATAAAIGLDSLGSKVQSFREETKKIAEAVAK